MSTLKEFFTIFMLRSARFMPFPVHTVLSEGEWRGVGEMGGEGGGYKRLHSAPSTSPLSIKVLNLVDIGIQS